MPKVLERELKWLSRGSPGFELFHADASLASAKSPPNGPQRKLAQRGSDIFVAVGKELRWSEVGLLKDAQERNGSATVAHRVLKTPAARPIQQLSVSPSGDYIAILTDHTCHVCILPAPSHLQSGESTPISLRSFQVGPTAHVLEKERLVSALWHPLSPTGNCLVTVTKDSCVRLWELDKDNRSTFDKPGLAVDLKKLVNAESTQADFTASVYGANKGFSPDDVEMQAASACFGGQGRDDEHGWASMTLWIAMTEGGVYALSPFLPNKWRAPATLLPSLSTSVVSKARAIGQDHEATESERRVSDQQCKWLAEVDAQEPMIIAGEGEFETVEVYSRPARPGSIPKLQGPFYLSPEPEFGEISDIYVIAPKIDDDALFDDEFDDSNTDEGLSVSIICLATSTNKVHVCLDLNGVEAEWLPTKRSRAITFDDGIIDSELLLFETIDLAHPESKTQGWPTFTASPTDRYELYATLPSGVYALTFRPWIGQLEDELANLSESGIDFRLNVLLESSNTDVDQPILIPDDEGSDASTAIAIIDPSADFVLFTVARNIPFSAALDLPSVLSPFAPEDDFIPAGALPAPEPRAPYQPAEVFFQSSAVPGLIKQANDKRILGTDLKSQVRFSPATLQLMTDAHRILSSETNRLGVAVADLFRRCERMRVELQDQIRKVKAIADKVDNVIGSNNMDDNELDGPGKIQNRIERSHEKTRDLNCRVEALRKKMLLLGGEQLSTKEQAFAAEVKKIAQSISLPPEAPTRPSAIVHLENSPEHRENDKSTGQLAKRMHEVQSLHDQLIKQAAEAAQKAGDENLRESRRSSMVGGGFRRQKLVQVMEMLERESALVEAVQERLARLGQV
ncbi:Hypothetical protein R9X50_00794500 [Acrodontium crateriforme]|uniref:Nuclear pore complex protein An-Nup82 n=1 Tax=Acrodontium crateriforme TaxID=150365 RepID=A0AAQ3R856_9PEZI|nr:Hypothetical protein R9X50_00794500 [Acrodontium crateriforme]